MPYGPYLTIWHQRVLRNCRQREPTETSLRTCARQRAMAEHTFRAQSVIVVTTAPLTVISHHARHAVFGIVCMPFR